MTSIDNSTELNTEVRVFPLKFAAADQMAATITSVFAQNQTASVRGNQRGQGFIQSMVAATQQANTSQRKQTESTVLAQADTRTNSVIVSAVSDVMEQIAKVIEQLDQNPAKSKKVYVYSVRNADPKEVTSMLQKIFGSSATAGTSTRSSTSSSRTGTSSNQRNSNSNNSNSNSNSSNRSSSSSSMR
jgi:type II secretory pathway component GspD/PulD (secretin)